MNKKFEAEDGRRALRDHVIEKALSAREKYGGEIDYAAILQILDDREIVRYPVSLDFDSTPLEPGEFAYMRALGSRPADGFCLHVHPRFRDRDEALPLLIAYHLVCANYGEVATHEEAELFGASLLGRSVDDYYQAVCGLADELSTGSQCAAGTGGE